MLGKSKQIAKIAKQSPQFMKQLQKECLKKKIPFRKPKISQETRWNSDFMCMESILHLKPVLKDLMESDDKWDEMSLWNLMINGLKCL